MQTTPASACFALKFDYFVVVGFFFHFGVCMTLAAVTALASTERSKVQYPYRNMLRGNLTAGNRLKRSIIRTI